MEKEKEKVAFYDMDHTFIQPKGGKTFPDDHTDWEFILPTKEKMLEFHTKGYKTVVVSNQGGVDYGEETHEGLALKFESIKASMNIPMDFFYCASRDKNDPIRKPNPGMAEKAGKLYNIDWENSIMVGDASGYEGQFSDSDRKFAENAGIGTYYDVLEFQKL
jgi:DNA 3'-phosphatase